MGITACNCLKDDTNNKGQVRENKNDIVFEADASSSAVEKIQSNWKGFKVRSQYNQFKFELNVPGVEIHPSQTIDRTNENIENTEKKLGKYNLPNKREDFNNNTSSTRVYSILYPDNTIYIGSFDKTGKKEGFGTLFLPDGSKYTGEFREDKICGEGRIIYAEGDYYEGRFDNNKPNGEGVFEKIKEGVIYQGQWKDEMKWGVGKESRSDGSFYVGEHYKDMKHGRGVFTWSDGSCYEGSFNCNDIDGFGRIVYCDMKLFVGYWKCNKIDGKGIFLWPDNKCYIGYYENDKKNGFGIFLFCNGKKYEGFWLNGKQHGYGICSFKGVVRLGEWRYGKKIRWVGGLEKIDSSSPLQPTIENIKHNSQDIMTFSNTLGITDIEDENLKAKLISLKL